MYRITPGKPFKRCFYEKDVPHKLPHQISLLADYTHFEQLFHYKTHKQPILLHHLSLFPMYIKFQVNLAEVFLRILQLNLPEI